ncbi:hypothetical protein CSUI_010132 [Cystoisospora suis]|uniref:Uncharacterized protein n=1 Tax=Cystoisospora suis TaxID=483139 RepID=A0A2C6KEU1_9APIC|nr:hypothetical protein CSUI_010132 [Cystoisospora suis]
MPVNREHALQCDGQKAGNSVWHKVSSAFEQTVQVIQPPSARRRGFRFTRPQRRPRAGLYRARRKSRIREEKTGYGLVQSWPRLLSSVLCFKGRKKFRTHVYFFGGLYAKF